MKDTIKEFLSKIVLIFSDIFTISIAVYISFNLRNSFEEIAYYGLPLIKYLTFYPLYIVVILLLFYEGAYKYRYDFWHETRKVIKAIALASILLFAYLAMTKSIDHYSRFVIGFTFLLLIFLIPIQKIVVKKILYKLSLWRKKANIHEEDPFLQKEIYGNHYLGYIKSDKSDFSTLFINSKKSNIESIKSLIEEEIKVRKNVIFTPILDEYDLTHSHIYELSNTRTNLIVFKNRLMSWHTRALQNILNYILAIILLPVILPILAIIAIAIKLESKGPIFFMHNRVGKDGKTIPVVKFRSMFNNSNEILKELLESDSKIKEEWESCFKLKDDPRVTKVGRFLRKTSLDELPQILNVLKGEMNFVGPRPVIQNEIDSYYKENAQYYYMVKPGITGLWQVSGRSDTNYDFRVKIDRWYVVNWSIWLDIVILFKTIKVVLKRDGAY